MTAATVDPDKEKCPKPACNHHCSVVEIGGFGVLIEGPSGSGKTSLALGLLERCKARGVESALVADDQALLACSEGGLKAVAPEAIRGMAEIRGYGIAALPFKNSAVVHLVVRLVDDEQVERMPGQNDLDHIGDLVLCSPIPLYLLPRRHEAQSVRIVMAVLENRFGLRV
ncbi:HPr kinase/phosphorylase [Salaquimonas pukyongi]|uniref:HPr kinase/phosphorylase n=1 Tax=Salaquimonas pukyongi TaxID=2712698 RepID=UPI00096BB16F|nr:hypothetical protein [Salaquimonas pukyongi]